MASAAFDEEAEAKRPTVQVGDPFLEKLLMEACLELMRGDALIAVQDMGAAGLTCSTSEVASRGGAGVEIDLDRVAQRETGMNAYEIMLSESQERMLLVVRSGREAEVTRIFDKWDLDAAPIGRVSGDGLLRVRHQGRLAAEVPCRALTDDAPAFDRPAAQPSWWPSPEVTPADLTEPRDWNAVVRELAGSPELASRRFVYEQYDHMVRSDTVVRPGGDAGVVRIKGRELGIAMTLDGNGRYTARDPRRGGALAVAEACRNLAAVGATPVGATNCLNFGNPERPEIMWEFTEAIAGMTEALDALGVPITGGNVSFYNETEGANIFPTPVVGVVGVLPEAVKRIPQHLSTPGNLLFLAGPEGGDALGASAFLKEHHGRTDGRPPKPDLDAEVRLGAFLRAAGAAGIVASARDLSEGGIAAAAIESLFAPDGSAIGAELRIECAGRLEGTLFGEGPGARPAERSPRKRRRPSRVRSARGRSAPAGGRGGRRRAPDPREFRPDGPARPRGTRGHLQVQPRPAGRRIGPRSGNIVALDPVAESVVDACLPAAPASPKMVHDLRRQPDGGGHLRPRLRGPSPPYGRLRKPLGPPAGGEVGGRIGIKTWGHRVVVLVHWLSSC